MVKTVATDDAGNLFTEINHIIVSDKEKVEKFISQGFYPNDPEFLIASELERKLMDAEHAISTHPEDVKIVTEHVAKVVAAFDKAAKDKMNMTANQYLAKVHEHGGKASLEEVTKYAESDMRMHHWSEWLLMSAGQLTLNEIIMDFKEEDEKCLTDYSKRLWQQEVQNR
jgi:archaellum component FlaD/FlaE